MRGFSYLTGGQGEKQQSSGSLSNGLTKSSSYGGVGEANRESGSTGRLGEFIRRQQDLSGKDKDLSNKDFSSNSLMSEFMNVRDTKFSSALKPRSLS